MKIAIIGSRNWTNKEKLFSIMDSLNKKLNITHIVSGGAAGADSFGKEWADFNKISTIIFNADWEDFSEPCKIKYNRFGKKYNALAGFKRNRLIVEESDLIIAFWDKKSPGTKDSLDLCKKLNKKFYVIEF